MKFTGPTVAAW